MSMPQTEQLTGCCCLFFKPDSDQLVMVAKGATTPSGKAVFDAEYASLKRMDEAGMNAQGITTPEPLFYQNTGGMLIAIQSAVPGELMKNILGRKLFAPSEADQNLRKISDWWTKLHEKSESKRLN